MTPVERSFFRQSISLRSRDKANRNCCILWVRNVEEYENKRTRCGLYTLKKTRKTFRYSSHFIKIRVLSAWFIAFYYIHKVVYQSPLPNSSIFSPSERESPYQLSVNPFPLCQLLAVTTSAFWFL